MKNKKQTYRIETVFTDAYTHEEYYRRPDSETSSNTPRELINLINHRLLTDNDYFQKMWRNNEFTGNSNYVKVKVEKHLTITNPETKKEEEYIIQGAFETKVPVSNSILMYAKITNARLQTWAFDDDSLKNEEKLLKYQLIELTDKFIKENTKKEAIKYVNR